MPTAREILTTKYGAPTKTPSSFIEYWFVRKEFSWFPVSAFEVNKDFKKLLQAAFKDLQLNGVHTEIATFNGCFVYREVRGKPGVFSIHSWGAAIDLNAKTNGLGTQGVWSPKFIQIMKRNKIYCGMEWKHRPDPMHFAMVNG